MNESLYELLEYFIEQKYLKNSTVENECRTQLKQTGKTEDEIHDILIEFDDEWTKEQLQGESRKKAKFFIIGGGLGFVFGGVYLVYLALLGGFSTGSIVLLAGSALTVLKGFNEIADAKRRKVRRALKWTSWK